MDPIPDTLYEDIKDQHSVLFAGAGISTESGPYGKPSFYDTIRRLAKYPKGKSALSFPDLMQYYCDHVDGGQRNRLTRLIIKRIEMFSAPGEINSFASMFHHIAATIPFLDRIVTTNWDPFFERAMNILVPMVEDRDLAFWDDQARQVLKIHGCVTRPYTLVATRDDYQACIRRYPLVFNKLRDLMATKTFVFVGYSMQDSDFGLILDEISGSLGPFRKLSFAIDPKPTDSTKAGWERKGVQIIEASGVSFLEELRGKLEKENILASRQYLSFLASEASRIAKIHHERHNLESPGAFFSAMYQDGLMHVLNDVLSGAALGKRDATEQELNESEATLKKMIRKKDLVEIAYHTGRTEVLRRFCARDPKPLAPYFDVPKTKPSRRFKRFMSKKRS